MNLFCLNLCVLESLDNMRHTYLARSGKILEDLVKSNSLFNISYRRTIPKISHTVGPSRKYPIPWDHPENIPLHGTSRKYPIPMGYSGWSLSHPIPLGWDGQFEYPDGMGWPV